MAWTTPNTTWVANEIVNEDDMNEIGANLVYLKDPNDDINNSLTGSDATTTIATFADVGAPYSLSITTTGGDVLVTCIASITHSAGSTFYFDLEVDGTRVGGANGILFCYASTVIGTTVSFSYWLTGLSAAAHTIDLQWRLAVAAGTGTLYRAAASGVNGQFTAREVS